MPNAKRSARHDVLAAALVALGAVGACNYDFDEFSGLAPPLLDGGSSTHGGAAGSGQAGTAGAGKSGAAGAGAADGGKGGSAGGSGRGGAGSDGGSGSSGSAGSGGGAAGGNGGAGGTAGAGAASGTGGAGGAAGGPIVDASADGTGGAGAGGMGTGGAGTAGTGPTGSGGTGGGTTTGTGGAGTGGAAGGAGSGGIATGGNGGTTVPDSGTARDVRVDTSGDRASPPFDCAAAGGRVYENHCYYANTAPVTWDVAAKETCAAPAHLVTITTAGEYNFVVSFLTDESRWIGLRRPADSPKNTSAFEWVTGETSTYTHWYSANGEPDYDGECVRLGPSNNWGDNPCSAAFAAVCERE
jgi:hypothetical protein